MHFHECFEGVYRIYAGALEAPTGRGYIAALVVTRSDGAGGRVAYRDDAIACGHRWPTPREALDHAISTGQKLVRERSEALRC